MLWQRSYWFRVPLTKQLKRDSVGHKQSSTAQNNVRTIPVMCTQIKHHLPMLKKSMLPEYFLELLESH